jgi:PAS domain S-box-containing protein
MKSIHWLLRYGIAFLIVLASLATLFIPVIGPGLVAVLFLAVLISAWQGGIGPGLFATILIECVAIMGTWSDPPPAMLRRIVELLGFFGLGVLITLLVEALHAARRRAEASQQWLSAVLTSIGDAVIATDAQGQVVFMNHVARSLCGWAGDEAVGHPLEDVFRIVNEQTRAPVENPVEKVLTNGVIVGLANHTVLIARDGVERPIDDSGAPIRNPRGEIGGVVLVFRDVTERRKSEDELRQANQRKDEFLAMLSHELRNPLAAIANAVQILLRPEAADLLDWCREVMDRQVKHLTRLVDDLLDVSRITKGKIQLRLERIELAKLLRSAAETVRPLIEERKHHLDISVGPDRIVLEADSTRLEQVVVNLLANSAKYSESGARIDLTGRFEGGDAIIQVRDNGIGIAPGFLPHVFGLFTQGDRSLARAEGGLGIGLTMVHKLIDLHGGTVVAHSDGLGQGSTFTIRLPARAEESSTPTPVDSRIEETMRTRILIIDDNVDLGHSLSRLLRLMGHETAIAQDGASGLQSARSFRPEWILLDIGLPGMDGYEVLRGLRQDETTKDARVVAITGYGQEEDRHFALASGFDDYLTKPVDQAILIALLQSRPQEVD